MYLLWKIPWEFGEQKRAPEGLGCGRNVSETKAGIWQELQAWSLGRRRGLSQWEGGSARSPPLSFSTLKWPNSQNIWCRPFVLVLLESESRACVHQLSGPGEMGGPEWRQEKAPMPELSFDFRGGELLDPNTRVFWNGWGWIDSDRFLVKPSTFWTESAVCVCGKLPGIESHVGLLSGTWKQDSTNSRRHSCFCNLWIGQTPIF